MTLLERFRFFIVKNLIRLAIWLEPNSVRNAMISTMLDQMRAEGIVGMEMGFDDEGAPALLLKRLSDLPVVTRH
jgi:hypothetical protein